MKNSLLKSFIRGRFYLTSRNSSSLQIRKISDQYLILAEKMDGQSGRRIVHVPRMLGLDENMRR